MNWKIIHNILYTEEKLQKMGRSNVFFFILVKTKQNLFYGCDMVKHFRRFIFIDINTYFLLQNLNSLELFEKLIILGAYDMIKNEHEI